MSLERVDFYLLATRALHGREQFVCRLVEKAWQQGHKIYLHSTDRAQALRLNRLLWTFRDGGFLPHDLYPDQAESIAPVRLGYQPDQAWPQAEVLINLAPQVPAFYSQFQRIVEIIDDEEPIKQAGRERFRFYRQQAMEPTLHDLRKS